MIDPKLGYDPIAHEENMRWLKERQANYQPLESDPTAVVKPVSIGVQGLIGALEDCRWALAALPEDALGLDPIEGYSYRDELQRKVSNALTAYAESLASSEGNQS